MKICLISRKFNKESGSAEWIYADRLNEDLSKRKFKTFLIEQKDSEMYGSKFKKAFHDFFYTPLKIFQLRFSHNVKLFHFLNENQAIFSFWTNFLGGKTITSFHDFMRINKKGFSLDKKYFYFVYKMASLSNRIVCNSSSTKQIFHSYYNKDQKHVKVIPCTHHDNLYPLKKSKKKLEIIGYLGALTNRKRVLKLADLAIEIKKSKLNLKIEIWGRGYLDKEIIKISKKENLHKIIKLKGMAPYKKINNVYNSFDFFVFPTEEEGLGLPIIEAMTCSIPVFVFGDAKIPEEIKSKCIVCKDEKDIVKRINILKKNRKKYNLTSKKMLKYSKNFNFESNLNKLIQVYRELR